MLACGLAVTLQRRQEIKIMEMEKTYNPAAIEEKIYDRWLQKKYFHAEVDTFYDCDAASKYYRTASYGSCP